MVRKVLLANTPPMHQAFKDVLCQPLATASLGSKVHGPQSMSNPGSAPSLARYVQLYISGFSCKPFSSLHNRTRLLDEPQAKVFWAVVNRIQHNRPAAFLLENVKGIARCLPQVLQALRCNGLYLVSTLHMDPSQLGEPVKRPRVYFFGVRRDVSRGAQEQVEQILASTWGIMARPCQGSKPAVPLEKRMLPAHHPVVVAHLQMLRKRWKKALGCWWAFMLFQNIKIHRG